MNPAQLRRTMKEKKRELRLSMKRAKRESRQRMDANPLIREQRTRKRIRRGVAVAIIAVLALVSRCACGEPPPPEPAAEAPKPESVAEKPKPAAKPRPKKKLDATTAASDRGNYAGEARAKSSWVDEYRLQVAARGSRLSTCFTGADKPGAIRWTASVNPKSGAVSDHDLEALASTSPIWKKERECLIKALSDPPYQLPADATSGEGIPTRMSIVIEF